MKKNLIPQPYKITRTEREKQNQHKGKCIWLTGLSGSGKSTLANLLEIELHKKGYKTYVLDGDNIRLGLNKDLGFSDTDRQENIRRVAEVTKLFVDAGIIVLSAFITPFEKDRRQIKEVIGKDDVVQIFVDCPLEICEQREIKGLYAKARNGEIKNFTGIDSPFETPENSDLVIHTDKENLEEMIDDIMKKLFI
ncbi:MAG: adenylyl-sulfate kinase [Gammaproteobacteria bacterium]|nr:adenylyl-sulfate kinase [Gammaproteobacteria bacterium]